MSETLLSAGFVEHVNILQGTNSQYRFSTGNCIPISARPFGMTHWTAQTDEGSWLFHPASRQLQGVRATHQPSPWIGDYGHFTVMPQVGERMLPAGRRSSAYRPDRSVFSPHYLKFNLIRYGVTLEVTPTVRCSIMRISFPDAAERRLIFDMFSGESHIDIHEDGYTVSGFTRANNGGVPENFALCFAVKFDTRLESAGAFQGEQVSETGKSLTGDRVGVVCEFGAGGRAVVVAQIATSFISVDQALSNLAREVGDRSFETIKAEGEAIWNETLGKVRISEEDPEKVATFYSCLYRAHLFPREFHEFDEAGKPVHYSPYNGEVRPGVLYTDNGFWDTYRTVYPLLAILQPERLADILEGWVQATREGGWFPQWASPGYRACMIGTHIDVVIADACVKGITGFDLEGAFKAMLKHAYQPGDDIGSFGRIGIADYIEIGYVPDDRHHHGAARTLDYAYDDFCIAQVADHLGRSAEAAALRGRATHYKNVFDTGVGFVRGRNADGSWLEPFNEFAWGGPYVEGGAWQLSWAAPHDPEGLIALMGGREKFLAKLDRLMTQEPQFTSGAYGQEIHEMTEMACADFGQYAHSNQPVHHILYLYAAAGQPEKTRVWVNKVLTELYSQHDLPGDEDNGEMSSWYILSSLGIYPLCPGTTAYTVGAPLFTEARVALPNGESLTITKNESLDLAQDVAVIHNGVSLAGTTIDHGQLLEGGVLKFEQA